MPPPMLPVLLLRFMSLILSMLIWLLASMVLSRLLLVCCHPADLVLFVEFVLLVSPTILLVGAGIAHSVTLGVAGGVLTGMEGFDKFKPEVIENPDPNKA